VQESEAPSLKKVVKFLRKNAGTFYSSFYWRQSIVNAAVRLLRRRFRNFAMHLSGWFLAGLFEWRTV
jgi:hypothetical protein